MNKRVFFRPVQTAFCFRVWLLNEMICHLMLQVVAQVLLRVLW